MEPTHSLLCSLRSQGARLIRSVETVAGLVRLVHSVPRKTQDDHQRFGSRMSLDGAKANVARTAHLTAWARALGRLTVGEVANGDYLAGRALLPYQRTLNRAPKLARWLLERGLPGAFGYFNARTQYFDEVLLQEARAGLEQMVILGAGFDSRSLMRSDHEQGPITEDSLRGGLTTACSRPRLVRL